MKESYWESMKNNAIILQNNQKSVNRGSLLMDQMKYLKELAVRYPNVAAASEDHRNLQYNLASSQRTEHYVSDVHGEYEKFSHIIRNGSGAIEAGLKMNLGIHINKAKRKNQHRIIYYRANGDLMGRITKNFLLEWHDTMVRLVHVARSVGNKYTRSKMRKQCHQVCL